MDCPSELIKFNLLCSIYSNRPPFLSLGASLMKDAKCIEIGVLHFRLTIRISKIRCIDGIGIPNLDLPHCCRTNISDIYTSQKCKIECKCDFYSQICISPLKKLLSTTLQKYVQRLFKVKKKISTNYTSLNQNHSSNHVQSFSSRKVEANLSL